MFLSSALFTTDLRLSLLFCFVSFFVRMWFLKAFLRLILPVPVILNLFFAPDLVFNLGMTMIYYYFFPFGALRLRRAGPSGLTSFLSELSTKTSSFLRGEASALLCQTPRVPAQNEAAIFHHVLCTRSNVLQSERRISPSLLLSGSSLHVS